ncbi:creatininase family protein [Streptomyces sp. NPDC005799]|uniref:creatininase family protein n=1 Tax=Streptomyces sp. NPDC005799 TaxID=3154678 RepID=UPI0033F27CDD
MSEVLWNRLTVTELRALAARNTGVVVTPSISVGLSEHHMALGGTLTISLPTLHALLRDVCRSMIRVGFSRILIVNGHGGNMTALNTLTTELPWNWRHRSRSPATSASGVSRP